MKYLGGYSFRYARGGVDLYTIVVKDGKGARFTIGNYWISVFGALEVMGDYLMISKDTRCSAENRWMYGETSSRLLYHVNETYALWIAHVGDYIVGGIILDVR